MPPDRIAPDILRLTAPNPGPMTATGTQTYLIGDAGVAVVDPGPDDPAHVAAIQAAAPGPIEAILVTHAHLDHSGAVPALQAATGAPVLAFGAAHDGRSPAMAALADRPGLAGGEGIDAGFRPDRRLVDGETLRGADWQITALHTPGHLSNHMCFALGNSPWLLTGDTVMGWSSTLISPPDGSVSAFLASLEALLQRPQTHYLPGHGPPVPNGPAQCRAQAAHRHMRARQIESELARGAASVTDLTARIYHDVPAQLHKAAARNVLAHLLDGVERGRVTLPAGDLSTGLFAPA
ncbi:MAG: MBL fold metallo-hydrolase [Pseudomonadota bacterium]